MLIIVSPGDKIKFPLETVTASKLEVQSPDASGGRVSATDKLKRDSLPPLAYSRHSIPSLTLPATIFYTTFTTHPIIDIQTVMLCVEIAIIAGKMDE